MLTKTTPPTLAQDLLNDFLYQLELAYKGRHNGLPVWLKELDTNDRNAMKQALTNLLSH